MRKRVVVTGMGWITPLGHDLESAWAKLLAGESGIAPTTLFDARTFPTSFAAEVKGYDFTKYVNDPAMHVEVGRNTQFALGAARQAWLQAGLALRGSTDGYVMDPYNVTSGLYLGSGEGGLDYERFTRAILAACKEGAAHIDIKTWGETAAANFVPLHSESRAGTQHAHHAFKSRIQRPRPRPQLPDCLRPATQAIRRSHSQEIIRHGDVDVMISGGSHSMIHPFGVTGFNRLTALSTFNDNPRQACRPFDATRGGFVLGEGSGIVILESLDHAQKLTRAQNPRRKYR